MQAKTNATKPSELQCPACKKAIIWSEKYPYRPFCSKRCQQLDFGDWATESFAIPGEPVFDPEVLEQGQQEQKNQKH